MQEQDLGKIFKEFSPSLVRLACGTCRNPSDGEDRVSEVFKRIQANPGITMGNSQRMRVTNIAPLIVPINCQTKPLVIVWYPTMP